MDKPAKPIGRKSYGSIPHLPGSRVGPGDWSIHAGQARILTEKKRDRHDRIVVTEKLDGSNVGVARIGDELIPLTRAGYHADSSPYPQHHLFASWVAMNRPRLRLVIEDGQRLCGEWLAQAHGTRYRLPLGPFVAFDIMTAAERLPYADLVARCADLVPLPRVLGDGDEPLSIDAAMAGLQDGGCCAAVDPVEGAVWRAERRGKFDFIAKFVAHSKVDGCYLPEIAQCEPVWNWRPAAA